MRAFEMVPHEIENSALGVSSIQDIIQSEEKLNFFQ